MQKSFLIILFLIFIIDLPTQARKHHSTRYIARNHVRSHVHRRHRHHHVSTFVPIKVDINGKVWGIDVSHHQSDIDWEKLNEQKPQFVFLKASEGVTNHDNKYEWNYKEAHDKNIPVGSYHFFTYKNSGKDQAKNFLSTVKYNNGDLPPVLDLEFSRRMPPANQVRNELLDFIQTIYEKLACYPIVYCNNRFFNKYLHDYLPEKCKLWIVDYKTQPDGNWTFWQTSNKHKLPGIKGYVDLNIFNGSISNLKGMLN
jgi:lysozyme